MFKKLSHPMIYVVDLERALVFYKEKLGFEVIFHHPQRFASLFHKTMQCRIDLHPTEAAAKDVGFGAITYFLSENMEQDIAKLKSQGIRVSEPRREGNSPLFATFWDSEGNAL